MAQMFKTEKNGDSRNMFSVGKQIEKRLVSVEQLFGKIF